MGRLRALVALALVSAVAAWYEECQDIKDWYHTKANGATKKCNWVGKADDYGRCDETGAILSGAARVRGVRFGRGGLARKKERHPFRPGRSRETNKKPTLPPPKKKIGARSRA